MLVVVVAITPRPVAALGSEETLGGMSATVVIWCVVSVKARPRQKGT